MSNCYRIYCRVSTVDQKRGYSLEHQKEVLSKFKPENYSEEVYIEAGSGKDVDGRPQIKRLLNDIQSGDIVAVFDISRLGRSTEDNLKIAKEITAKGAILSIAGMNYDPNSPSAELQLTIESAVGAFQRKVQHNKSISGIELKKEKGEWIFSPRLYGYRHVNKRIEIIEEEAKVIRFIFDSYAKGNSVYTIRKNLTANGVRNRKGTEFVDTTIYKFLFNPIFAGYYYPDAKGDQQSRLRSFGDKMIKSKYYQPIITLDLFNHCNIAHRSLRRKHAIQFQYRSKPYLFTSVFKCGECGARFVHTNRKYWNTVASSYRINHKKECSCNVCTINEDLFRGLYEKLYRLNFLYPKDLSDFIENERNKIFETNFEIDKKINDCKNYINEMNKEKMNLIAAIARIGIDSAIEEKIINYNDSISNIEKQIVQLEQSRVLLDDSYLDFLLDDFTERELELFLSSDDLYRNTIFKKYFLESIVNNESLVVKTIHGLEFVIPLERGRRDVITPRSIEMIRNDCILCVMDLELNITKMRNSNNWNHQRQMTLQKRIFDLTSNRKFTNK